MALGRWIEYIEFMRSEQVREALEDRQKEGGAGTVVTIFNRMVQRKVLSALRQWKRMVRFMLYSFQTKRTNSQHTANSVHTRFHLIIPNFYTKPCHLHS